MRASEAAGVQANHSRKVETNRALRLVQTETLDTLTAEIERAGGTVQHSGKTDLIVINDEFTASIAVARYTPNHQLGIRWRLYLPARRSSDLTIVVMMAPDDRTVAGYYILPTMLLHRGRLVWLKKHNGIQWERFRFATLELFWHSAARQSLPGGI